MDYYLNQYMKDLQRKEGELMLKIHKLKQKLEAIQKKIAEAECPHFMPYGDCCQISKKN